MLHDKGGCLKRSGVCLCARMCVINLSCSGEPPRHTRTNTPSDLNVPEDATRPPFDVLAALHTAHANSIQIPDNPPHTHTHRYAQAHAHTHRHIETTHPPLPHTEERRGGVDASVNRARATVLHSSGQKGKVFSSCYAALATFLNP